VFNSGDCTVVAAWRNTLLQHVPGEGGFDGVSVQRGGDTFAPGTTTVEGDFCYNFDPRANQIRSEFAIDNPDGNCQVKKKSDPIHPCEHTGSCPGSYSDLMPDSPYYTAVTVLRANEVVSAYADGTFRPYSASTRAQVAKIVVLAFRIPLVAGSGQRFSDVPANDQNARYIETAYAHGLISGYADGTFRPANSVTRGQLAKIVVQAAGLKLANPATPSFSDVAAGSAFYRYIETAHAHGLIAGYADGTFRVGVVANMGQVCKVTKPAAFPPE
jgi:hypothetical protein